MPMGSMDQVLLRDAAKVEGGGRTGLGLPVGCELCILRDGGVFGRE